jgi:hypothetical protein
MHAHGTPHHWLHPMFWMRWIRKRWRGELPKRTSVRLPWGDIVEVGLDSALGKSLWQEGAHDLALAEAFSRLVVRGSVVIQVAADVGYLGAVNGRALGSRGRLHVFQMDPELQEDLTNNLERLRNAGTFPEYKIYGGLPGSGSDAPALGDLIGMDSVNVMGLQAGGSEFSLLESAEQAFAEHRIEHVIFHDGGGRCGPFLKKYGYELFRLCWNQDGLELADYEDESRRLPGEAPRFVATVRPRLLISRCSQGGWKVLGQRLRDRDLVPLE